MIHSEDSFEDEIWLVSRLLKRNPNDPLALGLQFYLNTIKRPLSSSESMEFLNSIRRVAPHPMTHIGMPLLVDGRPQSLPVVKGVFGKMRKSS